MAEANADVSTASLLKFSPSEWSTAVCSVLLKRVAVAFWPSPFIERLQTHEWSCGRKSNPGWAMLNSTQLLHGHDGNLREDNPPYLDPEARVFGPGSKHVTGYTSPCASGRAQGMSNGFSLAGYPSGFFTIISKLHCLVKRELGGYCLWSHYYDIGRLNPALLVGPRGMITLQPSIPFNIGIVKREDLLTPCLFTTCISRDTRPCARSISWSQPGFASNSGCLLAVCTTDGRVKLYRPPSCEFKAEWVEVVDISNLLCDYLTRTNFGEPNLPTTSFSEFPLAVILPQKETIKGTKLGKRRIKSQGSSKDPVCKRSESIKKEISQRKVLTHGTNAESSQKHELLRWEDTTAANEAIPNTNNLVNAHSNINQVSSNEVVGVDSKSAMVVSAQVSPISESLLASDMEIGLPLISPEQYASRSALMSSLIVSWSPVLQSSQVQPGSCNRCVILAVGGKSGNISFWRIGQPECYTIEHDRVFVDPMLIGLFPAHNSWITTITWGLFASCSSISQLILVTGGSDGSVKIWSAHIEDLVSSSEVNTSPFSLINELTVSLPVPISLISLAVPKQSQGTIVLAIGKGSGTLEVWICHDLCRKLKSVGSYNAHDQVVTGLAWAYDGCCLYSCSQVLLNQQTVNGISFFFWQDNSIQSWVLHGDALYKVDFPSKFPGFKNSINLLQVSDLCFGLALSPGGLMIAAVRSFDSLLLNQMYQARTQKAVVEFFWIGGQSYEISPDKTLESSDVLSERDLLRWGSNILHCFLTFEDAHEPLVIWDIISALLEFDKYNPQFVDNLLLKWITSLFSGCPSGASIDKVLFHFQSNLSDISSRRICLLNIICRRLMLTKGNGSKNNEKFHIWNKLLINNESELQQRLVAFTLGAVRSHATCLSDVFSAKTWFPQGVAQMMCWVLLNAELVHNQLNVLGSELKAVGSR
ncbi:hypothetical protein ZIOFF_057142 [Zingiber officinale]|uniref:Transcription factor IIIC 90kDa subunit N-terminal domain-containing protein n=1 Tax=Zingiber officinale TaxID=94328 RepID=A0A8J5KKR0_ZINOF|nr:hypothetical protein ZIOFF_057142 [Zingiber officinale]